MDRRDRWLRLVPAASLAASLLAGTSAATSDADERRAAQARPGGSGGTLGNGVHFWFESLPGSAFEKKEMLASLGNVVARAFVDPGLCAYFGYQLQLSPAQGSQVQVSLGPLTRR